MTTITLPSRATTAAFEQSQLDDVADASFGIDTSRGAYDRQVRAMWLTSMLEADPDLAF